MSPACVFSDDHRLWLKGAPSLQDTAGVQWRHPLTTQLGTEASGSSQHWYTGQGSQLLGLRVELVARQLCSSAGVSLAQSKSRAQWVRGKMTNLLDQMLAASPCSASNGSQGNFEPRGFPFSLSRLLFFACGTWMLPFISVELRMGARQGRDSALIFWSRHGAGRRAHLSGL